MANKQPSWPARFFLWFVGIMVTGTAGGIGASWIPDSTNDHVIVGALFGSMLGLVIVEIGFWLERNE